MDKKAMFSSPMAGLTHEKVCENRNRAQAFLERNGYEFVNTVFEGENWNPEAMKMKGVVHIPVGYLAESLKNMSKCDAIYFMKDWQSARGCRIEHAAAIAYGLEIIYEDFDCGDHGMLRAVSEPVVDYLYKYGNPHACVIVTQTSSELLYGERAATYPSRD